MAPLSYSRRCPTPHHLPPRRSAPQRRLECQAEEQAVVACRADAECAGAVDAYERCAERVVGAIMNPSIAKREGGGHA